jgi:hypothetical protein
MFKKPGRLDNPQCRGGNASGNSHLRGARINRSADVTPEEFNAFCAGLKTFLVSFETNNVSENNDK